MIDCVKITEELVENRKQGAGACLSEIDIQGAAKNNAKIMNLVGKLHEKNGIYL